MDKEPSKAAIEKACEMLGHRLPVRGSFEENYSAVERDRIFNTARFIDHVSEVAKDILLWDSPEGTLSAKQRFNLKALILPDPEPDVLAELIDDVADMRQERRRLWFGQKQVFASDIRKTLAARGLEIRKVTQP